MISLRSEIGKRRRQVLCSFNKRLVPLGDCGPVVTFTFDDFPRNALTVGGEILERFGGRATYYVAMGLMGTQNNLGQQFYTEDLRELVARGHELASHTFSHVSARRTSVKEFANEVDRGEAAIREASPETEPRNFAYPYGEVTLAAKRLIGQGRASCRGTSPGLNGPGVDLNLLRANRLYGGSEAAEAAKQLILENEWRKSWLIFYSHDVDNNPSRFGCTPALLEEVVSFSAAHSAGIATIEDVVTRINGPHAT